MAIKQPSIQNVRKSGHISPQVLLVRYQPTERHTTLHFPNGIILEAGLFNTHAFQQERMGKFRWEGAVTIHLFRTDKLEGWCYLAVWDNQAQGYACSCFERRRAGFCVHCSELEHLDGILY